MRWTLLLLSLLLSLSACDLLGDGAEKRDDDSNEEPPMPICELPESSESEAPLPGTIVFSARDEAGTPQIYTIQPDGSELRQLTDMSASEGGAYHPAWNPGGTRILFSSYKLGTSTGPALWVMEADGSNLRVLHDFEPDNIHVPPLLGNNARWSPDGTRVAFDLCLNCQVVTNVDIYVFDMRAKEGYRLTDQPTDQPGTHRYPAWSPDGEHIAFLSNQDYLNDDTYQEDLYVVEVDGSNKKRLTEIGSTGRPVWNPNGRDIAFSSNSLFGSLQNGLFQLDTHSGEMCRIAEPLSATLILDPMAWSSDGRYLLILAWPRDTYQREYSLQIVDLASGEARSVFSRTDLSTHPNTNPVIFGAEWFTPADP